MLLHRPSKKMVFPSYIFACGFLSENLMKSEIHTLHIKCFLSCVYSYMSFQKRPRRKLFPKNET